MLFLFYGMLCYFVYLGCGEPMDCDSKMEHPGSPDREGVAERNARPEGGAEGMTDFEGLKGGAEEMESGKRKRKPYRPGKVVRISQNKYNGHIDV